MGFGQENDAQDLLLFRFPDAYRADLASIAHRVEAEVSAQGTLQDDLSLLRFSQGRQSFGTMQKDWTFDDMCVLREFSRNSRLLVMNDDVYIAKRGVCKASATKKEAEKPKVELSD